MLPLASSEHLTTGIGKHIKYKSTVTLVNKRLK